MDLVWIVETQAEIDSSSPGKVQQSLICQQQQKKKKKEGEK